MKSDYIYLGVIVVFIAMLIGSTCQIDQLHNQLTQQRVQSNIREIEILTIVQVLTDRVTDLRADYFRIDGERVRLLGLWDRIRPSVQAKALDKVLEDQ